MEAFPDSQTVVNVAERILAALSQPVSLQMRDYYVTCSIGIALYPNDGQDATLLLKCRCGDVSCQGVGKNNYQFFPRR